MNFRKALCRYVTHQRVPSSSYTRIPQEYSAQFKDRSQRTPQCNFYNLGALDYVMNFSLSVVFFHARGSPHILGLSRYKNL